MVILISFSSLLFALEDGLSFFHEGSAALDVILALEAGLEQAPGDEDLARERRADGVDEIFQRRGAVAEAELRRRDAEARVFRSDPQVAAQRDVDSRAQAVTADHGDDHLVAAQETRCHAAGDLLVALDALGG